MIRINLLASDRNTEKKKGGGGGGGGGAPSAPGALQLYLFLGLFAGGALVLCAGAWWFKEAQLRELDQQIQVATKRQQELQVIKRQVEEFQAKEKLLTEKVNLIERLKAEQANSVHMLDEISKALPDFVWLQNMDQLGAAVKFTGQSNSLAAVADFISNLQKTTWFPRVELDSSTEANSVVTFQLSSTFENPEIAAKQRAAAAAAAAAPAPAPSPKKS
jgi:type IV pilus assembly protein PilN